MRARAIMLALRAEVDVEQAVEELVAMAGPTPAAPVALNRALSRLRIANTLRPNRLTTAAIEALDLAHMRLTPVGQGDDQVMIRQRRFISPGMRDVQLR
jgi:urease accessory protein UreF